MASQKAPPSIPIIRLPKTLPQDDQQSVERPRMLDSPFQTPPRPSTSFLRIQQKLNLGQDSTTSEPIIYLLRCDGEIFQHYSYLVRRGEPVWVKPGGRSLNLALTADLWHDLNFCVANHEMRLLSSSLPSLIGAEHWLLQRDGVPDGYIGHLQSPFTASAGTRTSSGGSGPLKRKISNASSRSNHSRRLSVTTIDTGELPSTLEPRVTKPVPEYTCPLVAQGHCKETPYVKLGNCKNHVERVHRWYTDTHPGWSKEIVVSTRLSGHEVKRNMQPSPHLHNLTDISLAYVGTESAIDAAAASPGACATFGLDFPSSQGSQSVIAQNMSQTNSSFNMAENTRFPLESDSTFLDSPFCNDQGMKSQLENNNILQSPLPSRTYGGTPQFFNQAQQRAPSQAPPSPAPPWARYG